MRTRPIPCRPTPTRPSATPSSPSTSRPIWERFRPPVLVVAGDHDLLATVPLVMEMVNAIPNCRLHMVKGGGHVQHWEDLEDYNRVTLDFLLEQAK